jgi:peptidoglycan/xylan/chitin deacetylase (PgdA/CDA1 family)
MIDSLRKDKELWELFVRKEELGSPPLDQFGRFMASSSSNRTVDDPRASIALAKEGFRPEYPGGRKFAVCLTHDIDTLNHPWEARTVARFRRSKSVRACVRGMNRLVNPVWNFHTIRSIEETHGAKSTFFFMALKPGDEDFNYFPDDLSDEMHDIASSGSEVGLHGGHRAYNDLAQLRKEKDALERASGRKAVGYRSHYLKLQVPETWHLLGQAGFAYDSTLGYADAIGFRNGMCHPHRPVDPETGKAVPVLEIPLAVMDDSLFKYMRLDTAAALNAVLRLAGTVEACGGVLTLLWHNTYFRHKPTRDLYTKLLEHCASRNAWLTSGEELCRWWDRNDFLGQGAVA